MAPPNRKQCWTAPERWMKPDPFLWAIDITMPPIRFSSRHRVPQFDYMTYRCVLKRSFILEIVFWTLLIYHAGGGGGGGWLITSYDPMFPYFYFSPPHLFATFCSLQYSEHYLFIMRSITCCWTPTDNMGGGGWLITSIVCSVINAAL